MYPRLLALFLVLALSIAGCDVVAEEETTTGAATLPEGVDAPDIDVPQPPCTKPTAVEAVQETEFADAVTAAGKARAVLSGGAESDFRQLMFEGKNGYRVEMLECADITGDGIDEMIVGLASGNDEISSDWAVFTPANAAEWQLVLPMDGSRVESFEITDGELRFETSTFDGSEQDGSPSGVREGTVSFDAEEEQFVVEVPGTEGRTIKTSGDAVVKLGRLDTDSANLDGARKRFGAPTSIEVGGNLCRVRWSDLGMTINFGSLGGSDPCGTDGRVGSIELVGGPAAAAGWETEREVGVGTEESDVRAAYPDAVRRNSELVLAAKRFPSGNGKTTTIGALVIADRVLALQLFVGAAGE